MVVKQFYIINEKIKTIDEDGAFYITGIANTGERDLVGDVVTENALREIAAQAINRNLHLNHDTFDLDGIIGVITEASVEDEGVRIKARILSKFKDTLKELLDEGVRFGLSIAGKAHYEENSWEQIESWDLTEISLTPTPCDQGTMGTVEISKSFNDFIKNIQNPSLKLNDETIDVKIKDIEYNVKGDKMAEEAYLTEEQVIEIVNTAFNEKEEELLETVRKEFETKFEEINSRIEALENAEPKPQEPEGNETPEGEEGKGESGTGEGTETPEEEEEEDNKSIENIVDKRVEQILKGVFKSETTPMFNYSNTQGATKPDDNKSYTPREIAKMLIGDD